MQDRSPLITPVLIAGCVILMLSFAIRASFGVFQIPIAEEFGWMRADFSLAIAIQNHAWGIGQEKEDNGILVLLARDDRRIAINTGYGVEEFLTDALSRRIIETVILPEFREGDYYAGLDKGSDAIFQVLTGQFKAPPRTETSQEFPFGALLPFLIFLILMLILASRKNKGGGGNRGQGGRGLDIWDMIILSNMGRSGSRGCWGGCGGFGGGGLGGGGFGGGFGGGGFGGGGASGGW